MRMFLRLYILAILLLFTNASFGNSNSDSLLLVLENSKGSDRLELLNKLTQEYIDNSIDDALIYANELLELSLNENSSYYTAKAYSLLGELHFYIDEIDKSIFYFEKQLAENIQQNDTSGIADAYNNLGIAYRYKKENLKAIDCYLQSLKLKEKINDKIGVSKTLNNLGVLYFHLNDYESALEYYNKSYTLEKQLQNESGIATSLLNIGEVYSKIYKFDLALSHFKQSIDICQNINDLHTLEVNYFCLYEMYKNKDNHQQALFYYELFTDLKNERLSQDTKKEIAELEISFKTSEKQKEIELLKFKNKSKLILILILILSSFIFIGSLFLLIKQRNKIKRALKMLSERNKKISHQTEVLDNLNKTKDKFFSIISHDLKGAIGGFLTQTEFMTDDFESLSHEDIYDLLKNMNQSSTKLYSLLENLLQWSKTQTGNINPKPERFNINEMVDNTISIFKSHLSEKSLNVKTCIPKEFYAFADYNMIDTVLRNLILNAIKFSHPNSIILINTQIIDRQIQIEVKDNGVGINQKDLNKLFDIGQSFSNPGTNREKGTGLGLIICKEFIEMNKGKIWVKSEHEKGSTFIFTLPTP